MFPPVALVGYAAVQILLVTRLDYLTQFHLVAHHKNEHQEFLMKVRKLLSSDKEVPKWSKGAPTRVHYSWPLCHELLVLGLEAKSM